MSEWVADRRIRSGGLRESIFVDMAGEGDSPQKNLRSSRGLTIVISDDSDDEAMGPQITNVKSGSDVKLVAMGTQMQSPGPFVLQGPRPAAKWAAVAPIGTAPQTQRTEHNSTCPAGPLVLDDERPGPSAPREGQLAGWQSNLVTVLDQVKQVMRVFPDVDEGYLTSLLEWKKVDDLNIICNVLLENPDYPRKQHAVLAHSSSLLEPSKEVQETEEYFNLSKLKPVSPVVESQALDVLLQDFRMLSSQDIKWTLSSLKGHYAITRKALLDALQKWKGNSTDLAETTEKQTEKSLGLYMDFKFEQGSFMLERCMCLLKRQRKCFLLRGSIHTSLRKELEAFKQKAKEMAEHQDLLLALQVNEEQYTEHGQLIECGCCCDDFAFEEMTQCLDGHLFCKKCLVRYAQEAVFGFGRMELSCMEGSCMCFFPASELEKVLPEDVLLKYHERQAEEAVAATCGDELVKCPFCNFPALLDKNISIFSCPDPRCGKESCRKCQVLWVDHVGQTCEQVAEKDEVRLRVAYEERMTAARVRRCHSCGTCLVKTEGCNHMSCRCGALMCYICRKPIVGYEHFCQHPRSPGAACVQCKQCFLWSDPTEDDERMIEEIQKEGEAKLNKNSDSAGKRVGPSPQSAAAKRPRPHLEPPRL